MLWKFIHFYDKNKGILSKCHSLYSVIISKATYKSNKIITTNTKFVLLRPYQMSTYSNTILFLIFFYESIKIVNSRNIQ